MQMRTRNRRWRFVASYMFVCVVCLCLVVLLPVSLHYSVHLLQPGWTWWYACVGRVDALLLIIILIKSLLHSLVSCLFNSSLVG
jgi:hypothetical protein